MAGRTGARIAIFEADLMEEQYAYRPKRSGLGAVQEVHQLLNRGYKEVVDADLSSYFDTIPHHELMQVSRLNQPRSLYPNLA